MMTTMIDRPAFASRCGQRFAPIMGSDNAMALIMEVMADNPMTSTFLDYFRYERLSLPYHLARTRISSAYLGIAFFDTNSACCHGHYVRRAGNKLATVLLSRVLNAIQVLQSGVYNFLIMAEMLLSIANHAVPSWYCWCAAPGTTSTPGCRGTTGGRSRDDHRADPSTQQPRRSYKSRHYMAQTN